MSYFLFSLEDSFLDGSGLLLEGTGADQTYTTYLNAAGTYYVVMSSSIAAHHSGNYQLTTTFSETPIADPNSGIVPDVYEVNDMFNPMGLGAVSTGEIVTNATIHSTQDWGFCRIYISGTQDLVFCY